MQISPPVLVNFIFKMLDKMRKIIVSFSGGRTSAFMSKMLIDQHGKDRVVCVFANTGSEDDRTLDFVNECDNRWGLNVVWLEAKVNAEKEGTTYTLKNYKEAARNNEPFEDVVRKYGLPNMKYLHCTRELKERPIDAWIKDNFKSDEYLLAIGIRSDELFTRLKNKFKNTEELKHYREKGYLSKRNIFYPLLDAGIKKVDVMGYWSLQDFDLNLPEHLGNCLTCHKKSDKKLYKIARDTPEAFEFTSYIGDKYKNVKSDREEGRKIYRGNRTANDILIAALNENYIEQYEFDLDGCGESCEVFT